MRDTIDNIKDNMKNLSLPNNELDFMASFGGLSQNEAFLDKLIASHIDGMQQEEKARLEAFLIEHSEMKQIVNKLLNKMADAKNTEIKALLKKFLDGMLDHPELSGQIQELLDMLHKIETDPSFAANEANQKSIHILLQQLGSKMFNHDDILLMLQKINQESSSTVVGVDAELISKLKSLTGGGLLDNKNTGVDSGYKSMLSGGNIREMNEGINNNGDFLRDNPLAMGQGGSYDNLDSLLNSLNGSGSISIGALFMMLVLMTLLTRDIQAYNTKGLLRISDANKMAKEYRRFLDDLGQDMRKDLAEKDKEGDLYEYLKKIMKGSDQALKDKYLGYFKDFDKSIDFSEGSPMSPQDFAIKMNGFVSKLNDKVALLGSNVRLSLLPTKVEDKEGPNKGKIKIVFDVETDGPDKGKVKPDFFTCQSKIIDSDLSDSLSTMQTEDKARVEASQETARASSSMMSNFTTSYGQMLRGQ